MCNLNKALETGLNIEGRWSGYKNSLSTYVSNVNKALKEMYKNSITLEVYDYKETKRAYIYLWIENEETEFCPTGRKVCIGWVRLAYKKGRTERGRNYNNLTCYVPKSYELFLLSDYGIAETDSLDVIKAKVNAFEMVQAAKKKSEEEERIEHDLNILKENSFDSIEDFEDKICDMLKLSTLLKNKRQIQKDIFDRIKDENGYYDGIVIKSNSWEYSRY